jgi:hypothetical protein
MFRPDVRIKALFILRPNGGVKFKNTVTAAAFGIILEIPLEGGDKEKMEIGIPFI